MVYIQQRIQNFPDGRRYRRLANTKLVAIILICPAVVWIIVNDNNNTAAVVSSCRIKCLLVSLHQVRHGNHKQTNSRARDNSFAAIQLEFLWQPTPAIIVRQRKDKPFENKLQRSLVKKRRNDDSSRSSPKTKKRGAHLKMVQFVSSSPNNRVIVSLRWGPIIHAGAHLHLAFLSISGSDQRHRCQDGMVH